MPPKEFSIVPRLNMSLLTEDERNQIYTILEKHQVTLTQITGSQHLAVYGLSKKKFKALQEDLYKTANISTATNEIHVSYIQNCPGLNQCKYAVADSLLLGQRLERLTFSLPLPHKVKVSIAGCNMCCTEPFIRDIGIIAKRKGWTVVFGGNGGGRPRIADLIGDELAEEEVVVLVKKWLDFYIENAQPRQRTARFVEQYGIDTLKKHLS